MTYFMEVLPDPDFKIMPSGVRSVSGTAGQGFVSIKLSEKRPELLDRTLTGKPIWRTQGQHLWYANFRYNPMTYAQFAPINAFLTQRRNGLLPFYVSLPQYKTSKDPTFATWLTSTSVSDINTPYSSAGVHTLIIDWSGVTGYPYFGDLFTVTDPTDSLHTKAYMVSRVETEADYNELGSPGAGNIRLHFTPALQRKTSTLATINFYNPLLRVTLDSEVQEYSLDSDNLYEFSFKVKEAVQ